MNDTNRSLNEVPALIKGEKLKAGAVLRRGRYEALRCAAMQGGSIATQMFCHFVYVRQAVTTLELYNSQHVIRLRIY